MQYYFDRTNPLFLSQDASFEAVRVDVTPEFAQFVLEFQSILEDVRRMADVSGAPEDSAQQLAEYFQDRVTSTALLRGVYNA